MIPLILGLVLFFSVHLWPMWPGIKRDLVGRLGAGGYMAVFSLLSIAGLGLMIFGYGDATGPNRR